MTQGYPECCTGIGQSGGHFIDSTDVQTFKDCVQQPNGSHTASSGFEYGLTQMEDTINAMLPRADDPTHIRPGASLVVIFLTDEPAQELKDNSACPVADPGLQCRMSLRLEGLTWRQVLDVVLRSCRWGEDRIGRNLIRVASIEALRRELDETRRYEAEKKLAGPLRTTYVTLAYARARELAPLLQRFVSPRGEVAFDERTNTLIITDVGR